MEQGAVNKQGSRFMAMSCKAALLLVTLLHAIGPKKLQHRLSMCMTVA
jgi:hypothetical protein